MKCNNYQLKSTIRSRIKYIMSNELFTFSVLGTMYEMTSTTNMVIMDVL